MFVGLPAVYFVNAVFAALYAATYSVVAMPYLVGCGDDLSVFGANVVLLLFQRARFSGVKSTNRKPSRSVRR